MKKTITLFMALALVTSLFAVPVSPKQMKQGEKKFRIEQKVEPRAHVMPQIKLAEMQDRLSQIKHKAPVAKKHIARKAVRKTVMEESFTYAWIDNYYYEDDGSYCFVFTTMEADEDDNLVGDGLYGEIYFYPTSTSDISGTYSLAEENVDEYYSFIEYVQGTDTTDYGFESVTLTISGDAENGYQIVYSFSDEREESYSGTLTGVEFYDYGSGSDIYSISEAKEAFDNGDIESGDEISVKGYISGMFLKPSNFSKYGSVTIWLAAEEGDTTKEFQLYNCYGLDGDTLTAFSPEATGEENVDVTTVSSPTCSFSVGDYVEAIGTIKKYKSTYELNTGCYLTKIVPASTPTDTIYAEMNGDIDVTTMELVGYYFYTVLVNAQNDSIQFSADLNPYGTSPITSFTEEDGTVELWVNGDSVAISSMKMTLSEEADITIANVLIKTDEVMYNLIIRYFVPEAKDTVVVNFMDAAQVVKYSDYEMYMIAAQKSDYAFIQAIYTTSLEGEYTEDDMESMYTTLLTISETNDTLPLNFFSINTNIENVNDTFRMVTNYFAKDTIVYQLNMWYTLPEAKDTVNVLIEDAKMLDATADYGAVWAYGELPSQYDASFYIYTDSVEGSFTLADLEAENSYLGIINGEDTTFVDFLTLDIAITKLSDTTVSVVAQGMGSDEYFYKVTMTAALEVYTFDPYSYDDIVNVEKSFTEDEDITLSWNTEYFDEYGYVLLDAVATDGSEAYVGFYSDTKVIANGVYEINDSQEAPSVEASPGADEEGYIYPSFYSENEYENIWFLISGTVTITDTTIVIDALNSNSNTVNVTINLSITPPTPSEHTIVFADYQDTAFVTTDGIYSVVARKAGNTSQAPAYNTKGEDLRVYAKNTFEISATSEMTEIVFNISTAGLKRQATITPSTGNMAYDMTNSKVTWTGKSNKVTFTVGEKADYGSEGNTKAGQFDFTSLDIKLYDPSGLKNVMGENQMSKFIYGGQLYILKNGVIYNAQGQVVR